MSFFGLGPWEIILILVIVLIIFGPTKLPKLARSMGEALREFRRASREVSESIEGKFESESKGVEKEIIDEKLLMELAKKLGIETEGKSKEEIAREVIRVAKEKKIIE